MDFSSFVQAVLLGIVEGLTEFIPVSSTGHLIIAADLLNFDPAVREVFEVVIQLGAILAICVLYFSRLWNVAKGLFQKKPSQLEVYSDCSHFFLSISYRRIFFA